MLQSVVGLKRTNMITYSYIYAKLVKHYGEKDFRYQDVCVLLAQIFDLQFLFCDSVRNFATSP